MKAGIAAAFWQNMAALFRDHAMDDFDAFQASFALPSCRALRANTLKFADAAAFVAWLNERPQLMEELGLSHPPREVPWSRDGFYYSDTAAPGRSVAFRAGLFYIQEASAMLPAELLDIQPGMKVLDLCAAPGGKSGRLAARLQGKGLLWANDIRAERARILLRNLEQLGAANAVVSVADPAALAAALPKSFDRILLDAPCSGEGMFRRDTAALASWMNYGPTHIVDVQKEILHQAAALLRAGGEMLYSTCTFNIEENEGQIAAFLGEHPDFILLDAESRLPSPHVLSRGLQPSPALLENLRRKRPELPSDIWQATLRIWPQRSEGDGHFACLLKKLADEDASTFEGALADEDASTFEDALASGTKGKGSFDEPSAEEARRIFLAWAKSLFTSAYINELARLPKGRWRLEQGRLHLIPEAWPAEALTLPAVRLLKSGQFLAEVKQTSKGSKILPTHSYLLSLKSGQLQYRLDLSADDPRSAAYLAGLTLALHDEEADRLHEAGFPEGGYLAVFWEGFPLGWSLCRQKQVKNLYPAGWVEPRLRGL